VADVLTDRQQWRVSSPGLVINEWHQASQIIISSLLPEPAQATPEPSLHLPGRDSRG